MMILRCGPRRLRECGGFTQKIRAGGATFRSSAQKRPQLWLFEMVVGQIFDFKS
jgi:hypothetical protein